MPAPPDQNASSLTALADRCVQCGLCLPHCPTYRLDASEAESPRGRIAYARAVSVGLLAPTPVGDRHLDHCLGCLRCEQVCPAGVEYGAVLGRARAEQAARRPPALVRRVRLALLARPHLLNQWLGFYRFIYPALPASGHPLPRPPARAPRPKPLTVGNKMPLPTVAVFVGCVADTYESEVRAALWRCLQKSGIEPAPIASPSCCGTAAVHAGDAATATRLAEDNRRAFAGHRTVLCLASGCRDLLRSSLTGISEVMEAMTFLQSVGDGLRFRSAAGRRVALQLPCSQRLDAPSAAATRALLARIPGLEVIELPDTGCCGAAGLHMLEEPERAARLRQPLLDALAGSGATELLSANIGCRLHLANGTRMPVRHPVEILAEHLE